MSATSVFQQVAIIGLGLIGSSLAHAIRRRWASTLIIGYDNASGVRARARELGFCDDVASNAPSAVANADLVLLCVPVGAMGKTGEEICRHLKQGCVLSDTGSVKSSIIADLKPHVPDGVTFIPGHPVAGTEESGPEAGFAELFDGRWCILTPLPKTDKLAFEKLEVFWKGCGAKVTFTEAAHHDLVLAITSHVPHLIAFGIVDTAAGLEQVTKSEVIKFSGGGFRDFTRIAASNATMWRDVFLHNRNAVLEMLDHFSEDLDELRNAIVSGNAKQIEEAILRAQTIRHRILEAGEDVKQVDFGRVGKKER